MGEHVELEWAVRTVFVFCVVVVTPSLEWCSKGGGLFELCCGGVLLSHTLSGAVPLAFVGLASGFGMFPGVSPLL